MRNLALENLAIYGDRGALDCPSILVRRYPWTDIIPEFHSLFSKGISLHAFVKKKVDDGEQMSFWEDSWLSDPLLKNIFPRLYALETNKHASVAAKFRDTSMSPSFRRVPRGGLEEDQFQLLVDKVAPVILSTIKDRWVWTLDFGGEFSVKSARSYIDYYLLSIVGPCFS
nr:RNA-directed DNA polymerase, eukaryota [Tanacetum cinerariifolium]